MYLMVLYIMFGIFLLFDVFEVLWVLVFCFLEMMFIIFSLIVDNIWIYLRKFCYGGMLDCDFMSDD